MVNNDNILIKFQELEIDKSVNIDTEHNSTVNINRIIFKDGFISRIEVVKQKFSDGQSIFIHGYMGNVRIATIVCNEDYVIEVDKGMINPYYFIRKAESYDYEE